MSDQQHTQAGHSDSLRQRIRQIDTRLQKPKQLLLSLLDQYRMLDHIARGMGFMSKTQSYASQGEWRGVITALQVFQQTLDRVSLNACRQLLHGLSHAIDELEHGAAPLLKQSRERWMWRVLLLECVLVLLFAAGLYLVSGGYANMDMLSLSSSLPHQLSTKPLLLISIIVGSVGLMLSFHFALRQFVLSGLLCRMPAGHALLDYSSALKRNARFYHSIFRPDPVGWNSKVFKQLEQIRVQIQLLQEELDAMTAELDSKVA